MNRYAATPIIAMTIRKTINTFKIRFPVLLIICSLNRATHDNGTGKIPAVHGNSSVLLDFVTLS
jgi:hypothetical protein